MDLPKRVEEYFWSHTDRGDQNDCWEWQGTLLHGRYGVIKLRGEFRDVVASKIALWMKLGRPIRPGFEPAHSCDNSRCVNPNHLEEKTHLENMRDGFRRGRMRPGGRNVTPGLSKEREA